MWKISCYNEFEQKYTAMRRNLEMHKTAQPLSSGFDCFNSFLWSLYIFFFSQIKSKTHQLKFKFFLSLFPKWQWRLDVVFLWFPRERSQCFCLVWHLQLNWMKDEQFVKWIKAMQTETIRTHKNRLHVWSVVVGLHLPAHPVGNELHISKAAGGGGGIWRAQLWILR